MPHDYIIIGAGNAGAPLASLLAQQQQQHTVLLLEAGPDAHDDERVRVPLHAPRLHHTELEWNIQTPAQPSLDGRSVYQAGGRMLSGSSAANYGLWTRGHEADYEEWARDVGDERWAWDAVRRAGERVLRRIVTSPPAEYPMRETMRGAFAQAGLEFNPAPNEGDPFGYAFWTSNWRELERQPAGKVYDLGRVDVRTGAVVERVLVERDGDGASRPRAVGAVLAGGEVVRARKEVIVCCGAMKTPQVLMLSGIGPRDELERLGVHVVCDAPLVGKHLHDHAMIMLFWKLKNPHKGLAMGSPNFPPPKVGPSEWVYTGSVPAEPLKEALRKDGVADPDNHPHVRDRRAHFEMTCRYGPVGAPPGLLPTDGSIISTGAACLLGTTRGTVSLASADPSADPIVDPNYLSTNHDRCVIREAMKNAFRIMDTPAAREEVEGLFIPPGTDPVHVNSTDAEFDAYIRKWSITFFHLGGTAGMGRVVDSECRVKGVEGLRVVDASILPKPLAAHLQFPVYTIAEIAADIILNSA